MTTDDLRKFPGPHHLLHSLENPRRTFTSSIYLRHGARVLLVKHKRFNQWLPLGGEREGNETPLETAMRELREEAPDAGECVFPRTDGPPGTPLGFLCYEEHDGGSKGWHMNFAFVADVAEAFVGLPCSEHDEQRWFSLVEIVLLASRSSVPPNVLYTAGLALREVDSAA